MDSLTAKVPAAWVPHVRPFLQRADEFQQKDPVVAYFLRTHAAHVGVKRRTREDKEGTKFLNALLEQLSQEKSILGERLTGVDGRTILTKMALALFKRADDEEQAGQCNLSLVRLFFTSAVLFEATGQFTKDGSMDPIAAERCRYAKYTASRMKKSIDSGEGYARADAESRTASISPPVERAGPSRSDESGAATTSPHSAGLGLVQDPLSPPPPPSAMQDSPSRHNDDSRVTMDDVFAAQRHAKQAVSALQFLDHQQAIIELRKALTILEKK